MRNSSALAPRLRRSGEETRLRILEAAEAVFAERGFEAARLEEVAEQVGIRRASLVYYFRDKSELYLETLAHVLAGLRDTVCIALGGPGHRGERVERAVAAWHDYVGRRPTVARLLLREVADADPERTEELHRRAGGAQERWVALIREGQRAGEFQPLDPIRLATTLIGASVFFFTATPILAPDWPFDPTSEEQLAEHRSELLRITRRLLGTQKLRAARRGDASEPSQSRSNPR